MAANPVARFPQALVERARPGGRAARRGSRSPAPLAADDVAAKLGYLREADVFAPLSPAERRWLAESTTMVAWERGHVFYTPDDRGARPVRRGEPARRAPGGTAPRGWPPSHLSSDHRITRSA
jgi:hypothetical protein